MGNPVGACSKISLKRKRRMKLNKSAKNLFCLMVFKQQNAGKVEDACLSVCLSAQPSDCHHNCRFGLNNALIFVCTFSSDQKKKRNKNEKLTVTCGMQHKRRRRRRSHEWNEFWASILNCMSQSYFLPAFDRKRWLSRPSRCLFFYRLEGKVTPIQFCACRTVFVY